MNNKIKKGGKYIIQIKAGSQNLTYTGCIISYDDKWVFVKDKFNKTFCFPIYSIISLEEVEGVDFPNE